MHSEKRIDLLGEWYLPEYPDEKRSGRLYLESKTPTLEILGQLRNIEREKILSEKGQYSFGTYREAEYKTIVGEGDGKFVTLFDSFIESEHFFGNKKT
jgi:hypothetical protein